MPLENGHAAGEPSDVADYVAEMATELCELAHSAGLPLLGYILGMAEVEAKAALRLTKLKERFVN